jgi:hypothetical protein
MRGNIMADVPPLEEAIRLVIARITRCWSPQEKRSSGEQYKGGHFMPDSGREQHQRQNDPNAISPAMLQKYLKGVNYPASKKDLVQQARSNNAEQEIVQRIQTLPGDSFSGPQEVMKALGQVQ